MLRAHLIRTFSTLALALVLSAGLPLMAANARGADTANNMNIAKGERDNRLADAVRTRLHQAGFVDEAVMVEANGGTITLSGSVLGKDRVRECEQIVRGVEGVKHVANKLTFPPIETGGLNG